MRETLERLGMTKNMAKVYLALLELGSATSGQIIKKTGFQSSVVYHLLNQLLEKGFVSYVTTYKKKTFSAADPAVLQQLIDRRQERLKDLQQNFLGILPQLHMIQKTAEKKQNVTIFKGKKGIQTVQNMILEEAKEYCVYATRDAFKRVMPKYRKLFEKLRRKKKISVRVILPEEEREKAKPNQERRYMPRKYAAPLSFLVWGNKVNINIWDGDPLLAVLIESKAVHDAFKGMFEDLWQNSDE